MSEYFLPRVLDSGRAGRAGITRSRVRTELAHGQWRRIRPGFVLTRPEEPTRADWATVGLMLVKDYGALSGWDAVRQFGLGEVSAPNSRVLILTDRGGNRVFDGALIRHVRGPLEWRTVSVHDAELPLAHVIRPSRAILDCAMEYRRLPPVRALVTAAVQRRICTPEELSAEVPNIARRGSALIRHTLVDLLDGARSEAEARALTGLRRAAVPPFEMNVPLVDERGEVVAIADFLWRELRAVLEIDGREFHFAETSWQRTMARHNRLATRNLTMLHYPPSRIAPGSGWLDEVTRWLRARARDLGVTYRAGARAVRDPEPFLIAS